MKWAVWSNARVCAAVASGALSLAVLTWLLPRPPWPAPRDPIIATAMDSGYLLIGSNFLCNMRRLGLQHQVVVHAMDLAVLKFLVLHFPDFNIMHFAKSGQTSGDAGQLKLFGTPSFNRIARLKIMAMLRVMSRYPNRDVLFSDPDITWCNNPLHQLTDIAERDRSTQPAPPDLYFSRDPPAGPINSGFYLARNSQTLRAFLHKLIDADNRDDDQQTYTKALCMADDAQFKDGCLNEDGIRAQFLNNAIFSNGKTISANGREILKSSRSEMQFECSANSSRSTLHWNYIVGLAKERKIKEAGFWYLNDTEFLSLTARSGRRSHMCVPPPVWQ